MIMEYGLGSCRPSPSVPSSALIGRRWFQSGLRGLGLEAGGDVRQFFRYRVIAGLVVPCREATKIRCRASQVISVSDFNHAHSSSLRRERAQSLLKETGVISQPSAPGELLPTMTRQ